MSKYDEFIKLGEEVQSTADVEGSQELKPCPFCGGVAVHSVGETGDGLEWPYIECEDCGAAVEEAKDWNRRASDASGYVRGLETAVDAIEADDVMYWPMADKLRALISHHQETK